MGCDFSARRAEVDQDRYIVLADDDVVGGDIAVEVVGPVDELQRVKQRADDGIQLLLARRAAKAFQPGLEAQSFLELEHHVGGVVSFEVAVHANDVWVIELRQRFGFFNEPVAPPLEIAGAVGRTRHRFEAVLAGGEIGREILLQRDDPRQRAFFRQISHAEAARAQHALDAVISHENSSDRQRDEVRHNLLLWFQKL